MPFDKEVSMWILSIYLYIRLDKKVELKLIGKFREATKKF